MFDYDVVNRRMTNLHSFVDDGKDSNSSVFYWDIETNGSKNVRNRTVPEENKRTQIKKENKEEYK